MNAGDEYLQTTAILDENFRDFLGFEWLEFRFLSRYLWMWWNLQQLEWILSFGKSSTLVGGSKQHENLCFFHTGVRDNWMFTTLSFSPAFVELVGGVSPVIMVILYVHVQQKKITSGVIVRIPTASIGARLDSWDLPEMASRNMGNEWGRPIPSGKLTVRPSQIVGFGRWMFPLKLGYFQGPTVNLPEGNPCSKKKDPYLAAWLEISIEPKCTTLLNSATCCPRIGNKTLLLEEKSSDGRL